MQYSVRKRIREIKHVEVSLPVLLATSITKTYESLVTRTDLWNWVLATFFIAVVYLYWDILEKAEENLEHEVFQE